MNNPISHTLPIATENLRCRSGIGRDDTGVLHCAYCAEVVAAQERCLQAAYREAASEWCRTGGGRSGLDWHRAGDAPFISRNSGVWTALAAGAVAAVNSDCRTMLAAVRVCCRCHTL